LNLRGGKNENGTGVLLEGSRDSGHGAGLSGGDGTRSQAPELVEGVDVRNGDLGEKAGLVHHGNGLLGVVALGGLTRQHDTVGAVKDGVANIGNLSTGGAGVVGHALEHLGGGDDGLAGNVALGDHHLLGDEDLGGRDLDTEITTGNHDTVSLLENGVEVVHTLLVLDLGNDLDVLAILTEDLADGEDVLRATDERGEDHVDLVLDTETEIGLVLLGESGKVNVGLGKVDTLLGGDLAVVDGLAADGLVVNDIEDLEGEDTVVNVDCAALLDDLGDVLVVDVHVLGVGGGGVLLVGGDVELGAGGDGDVLIVGGVASADLRALGVEGDGNGTASLGLLGLAGVVDDGLVVLVAAVGEVHANDVHAGSAEHVHLLGRVGLRAWQEKR
jgi:hypothetical protein